MHLLRNIWSWLTKRPAYKVPSKRGLELRCPVEGTEHFRECAHCERCALLSAWEKSL